MVLADTGTDLKRNSRLYKKPFGICRLSVVKEGQPAHSLASLWSIVSLKQCIVFYSLELIEMFVILAKIHDQQSDSSNIP